MHLVMHVEENEGIPLVVLEDWVAMNEGISITLLKHQLVENHDGKH